jgi:hypothetical protein
MSQKIEAKLYKLIINSYKSVEFIQYTILNNSTVNTNKQQ